MHLYVNLLILRGLRSKNKHYNHKLQTQTTEKIEMILLDCHIILFAMKSSTKNGGGGSDLRSCAHRRKGSVFSEIKVKIIKLNNK